MASCSSENSMSRIHSDLSQPSVSQRKITEFYFHKGYMYRDIVNLLEKYHNVHVSINIRTLERRLKDYGLQRRENSVIFNLVCSAIFNLVCSAIFNLVCSAIFNFICSAIVFLTFDLVCSAILF